MKRTHRVVALGGGTGLPVVLQALRPGKGRQEPDCCDITAIVTVTDDGGSSGRLRREMGAIPPGDLRNCLVALSDAPEVLRRLFQHRFSQGELEGHSFGNLFITALAEVTGDFAHAVRSLHEILAIRGSIFPSTEESVQLVAHFEDGSTVRGEAAIPKALRRIRRVALEPAGCVAPEEACEALRRADAIVLGPGSLYTSVLPNLLVRPIAEALRSSPARKVYVSNLATQPGETDGYAASHHVQALFDHVGRGTCDTVVLNSEPLSPPLVEAYRREGAAPLEADTQRLAAMGLEVIRADLLATGPVARHDPDKLRKVLLDVIRTRQEVA
jgi:uncharacterized cofD-like protein